MAAATVVTVEGRELKLSNLDKVLYPEAGFTKGDVIDYYTRVAPTLLPHLKDRPLTLKRYPDGVEGEFFYEKQCPKYRPKWMRTIPVWSERQHKNIEFCCLEDLPGLVWVSNLADLEMHTSLSVGAHLERPTAVAFDLDPGPATSIVECCDVALALRKLFDDLGLEAYPKTSGSKGMQLYLPLNSTDTYDESKAFAHAVAGILEHQLPKLVVSDMKKELRKGKVLIDWSQNDFFKTTVCVYSLRAKETPTVSTPITWDEVEATAKERDPAKLRFTSEDALSRIEGHGDLFAPVLTQQQTLPKLQ
ncbi:MAG TPA: non-homologous end-joining DNA ligase [Actinomycetota bacterium]|nr:non-homologous end-joining DNA ligase [Actinomycetota bacterium]